MNDKLFMGNPLSGKIIKEPVLKTEYDYYVRNKQELIKQHNKKFIVIKGETVLGSYKSDKEALNVTLKHYKAGTFLIHYCSLDDKIPHFYSRVFFD